jgi:LysM repeat protein
MNPRKLFFTLTVASLVFPPFLSQALAASEECYYRVINVSLDDVLWMRLGPTKQYRIVGAIPSDANQIEQRGPEFNTPKAQWMPIKYKETEGWVNRRYLAENCQLNQAIEEARHYTLKQGDTLYSISKRYGTTVKQMAKWNNLQAPYNLSVGQSLRVVPPICGYRVVNVAKNDQLWIRAKPQTRSEAVGRIPFEGTDIQITGETLSISKLHWAPIRYQSIEGWVNRRYLAKNCHSNQPIEQSSHDTLKQPIEQSSHYMLKQPIEEASHDTLKQPIEEANYYYTVKQGDTLFNISQRYGRTIEEMAKWNHLQPPYDLYIGQSLRVVPPICGYRIVNVAKNDQLWIRAEPHTRSYKKTGIPFDGTDIQITGQIRSIGESRWAPIRYQSIEGWVNAGYLEKEC